jgi:hypothetical protein
MVKIEVRGRVRKNPATMTNSLPSSKEMAGYDQCCGIHGAARARKGAKHAASVERRHIDKRLCRNEDD